MCFAEYIANIYQQLMIITVALSMSGIPDMDKATED